MRMRSLQHATVALALTASTLAGAQTPAAPPAPPATQMPIGARTQDAALEQFFQQVEVLKRMGMPFKLSLQAELMCGRGPCVTVQIPSEGRLPIDPNAQIDLPRLGCERRLAQCKAQRCADLGAEACAKVCPPCD